MDDLKSLHLGGSADDEENQEIDIPDYDVKTHGDDDLDEDGEDEEEEEEEDEGLEDADVF